MNWLWWVQVAADALLIGAVIVLLVRLGRLGGPGGSASAGDMERFISEAGQLGQEFDRLLAEKRELIGSTLGTLDQRVESLRQMLAQANQAAERQERAQGRPPAPEPPPAQTAAACPGNAAEFKRKVQELQRMGRSPAQIAQATGRPRGEVELALGLLSSNGC